MRKVIRTGSLRTVTYMPDGSRLRRAAQQLRGIFGPRAAILMYHRIVDSASDPYTLCVTPQNFAEHLHMIREVGYPMRLQELARRLRNGELSSRAVCVTFDDGYQDNLYTAKPLLEKYDVPASVFMTTGTIGRHREFWWDELERILLQPGRLPTDLQLEERGQYFDWDLGDSSMYGEGDAHHHREWTILNPAHPTRRHAALRVLHGLLLPLGNSEQRRLLDRLLSWAGMAPTIRKTHRALEADEVVALEKGGIIEVAAHTVNHVALAAQPSQLQFEEIQQSKNTLEQWLGHPVSGFAYPYGLYSNDSVAAVQESGFEYACACSSTVVRRNSDLFQLPRLEVFNWNGDEFARRLRRQVG